MISPHNKLDGKLNCCLSYKNPFNSYYYKRLAKLAYYYSRLAKQVVSHLIQELIQDFRKGVHGHGELTLRLRGLNTNFTVFLWRKGGTCTPHASP